LNSEVERGVSRLELALLILLFVLWVAPAPLVNRLDVAVLGIPVLWFYYLALSFTTALAITALYLYWERRGRRR
jgi:hypothetical protein